VLFGILENPGQRRPIMNLSNLENSRGRRNHAFSIVEAMVGVALLGVVFVSLYMGISNGFAFAKVTRENLRATQILQEKMETIRLYTWEQMTTPGFVPTNFFEGFYASGTNNGGVVYTGRVEIARAPISEAYSNELKQVTISLTWASGRVVRSRQMITLSAKHGLQNYIY
jgi:type II secretory pathway pseudopilin PulG